MRPSGFGEVVNDPTRVKSRAIDLAAYASDASHFLLTPAEVVIAENASEVAALLARATKNGTPVTFRSGGTSLSGQASSDGVLIDTRRGFRRIDVLDDGLRVRVQPGATVRQVNARLLRYGRRLGPDPASEAACTIGGVVANNSSGMACGIVENTYCTLESMVFVLPSGTTINTADADADRQLRAREPDLVEGIIRLQHRVRQNPRSVAIIERQFAMKNTMGYGVNAFLDFDSPVEVLAHLLIGSEGTLAFIAEATFRTVAIKKFATTALAVFPTLADATAVLPPLIESRAATIELMDSTSVRVGQAFAGAPAQIVGFEVASHSALLIEYHAADPDELRQLAIQGTQVLDGANVTSTVTFFEDEERRAKAWKLRKGLYASVAGARPTGTTALLEDIVVPVPSLASTCDGLQGLFKRFDYSDSVVFGHAKDGNIHFMLTDRFQGDAAMRRFDRFTDEMVELVLGAGGNLKAEHGTGRAMAPYVQRQYGDELYDVMRGIKALCDPAGVLNPGVIITDDPASHLRDFKHSEPVDVEADRCVECGYCEPVCPSKDLTLTPRQRIVVRRAMARAEASGNLALTAELERDFDYAGVDTCAVDGMCATACPVRINTGTLVKRLRQEARSTLADQVWDLAARKWGPFTRAASVALTVGKDLPEPLVRGATALARTALGQESVPSYSADLPGGGQPRRSRVGTSGSPNDAPAAVYLPACVNSMFGAAAGGIGVTEAFCRLLDRAGLSVVVPEGIDSLCCSTPWTSKGYQSGRERMARRVIDAVTRASRNGELVIISDATSCTEGFSHLLGDGGLGYRMEDAVGFVARVVLPRLGKVSPIRESLVLHPTCSSAQMGLDPAVRAIGEAVARDVTVPDSWGCCGFAGDRGMLHPELTQSATAAEAAEVRAIGAQAHASCNRTCEIGMTRATGATYRHVIELLEEATRP